MSLSFLVMMSKMPTSMALFEDMIFNEKENLYLKGEHVPTNIMSELRGEKFK